MSSATKTFELLSYFSITRPEIGLSQMCKLAMRDKATTHRHLQDLELTGFIEQSPYSKLYRLGPAVLQLAQIREETVPRKAGAEAALPALAMASGETAHATILSGKTVYALASCESQTHGTRAIIDIEVFPLHATASGLCAVAFGPANLFEVAALKMENFTSNTPKTKQELTDIVQTIRETGFGRANRTLENEVCGMSAPLFDVSGSFAGAVSVASVATRFTPELERIIQQHLVVASLSITKSWGGTVPKKIQDLWSKTLSHFSEPETTS